jgi:hypothetical protein
MLVGDCEQLQSCFARTPHAVDARFYGQGARFYGLSQLAGDYPSWGQEYSWLPVEVCAMRFRLLLCFLFFYTWSLTLSRIILPGLNALESAWRPAKYSFRVSYLLAIVMPKNNCVENVVALLGIGVKGIRGSVLTSALVRGRGSRKSSTQGHPSTALRAGSGARVNLIAALRTPSWLASGWEHQGRRPSRG